MPIHENGFLSKDMIGWIQKHRTEHRDYFLLCVDLNRFFHKMLYAPPVEIDNQDRQQLLVASLSLRALSTFQAVILLSERGLTAEVKILLRSLLEVLFRACAIAKDERRKSSCFLSSARSCERRSSLSGSFMLTPLSSRGYASHG